MENNNQSGTSEPEQILPISDYAGLYVISNHGYVKSLDRVSVSKSGYTKFYPGKEITANINCWGRPLIRLYKNGTTKTLQLGRLVGLHFIPNPDNKPTINHKDGNPMNNHVSNLEWATYSENFHHGVDTGLIKIRGENNSFAKLSDSDIPKIRELLRRGVKRNKIASQYKVSYGTIYGIDKKLFWKSII